MALPDTSASGAEHDDPFAAFDDIVAGTTRDPYPALAVRRHETPVVTQSAMFGESWTAYRFEDCSRILRDAKTFTSVGYDTTIGAVMGHMILGMDDPEHRMHRNLVAHAFREKALARWEPDLIVPIIDELIDRFEADGQADLVRQLTFKFPVRVMAGFSDCPSRTSPASTDGASS